MLIPFMIFLMILSPVLIPAAVTIVNVMQGNHRPAGAAISPLLRHPRRRLTSVHPSRARTQKGAARLVYGASGCRTAAPYQ